MKTKDLERIKKFLDVISGSFAHKGTEDERHDLHTIVQNEIVRKKFKTCYPEKEHQLIDESDMGKLCQNIADRLNKKEVSNNGKLFKKERISIDDRGYLVYDDIELFSGTITIRKGKIESIDCIRFER